jgi:hypothetical protein
MVTFLMTHNFTHNQCDPGTLRRLHGAGHWRPLQTEQKIIRERCKVKDILHRSLTE